MFAVEGGRGTVVSMLDRHPTETLKNRSWCGSSRRRATCTCI